MASSGWFRSRCWALVLLALAAPLAAGCDGARTRPNLVWGQRGVRGGQLVKPRAIAINPSDDRLYIVDWTARIQAFDRDGNFLGISWTTPDYRNGRPSGLSVDGHGNLVVSDSHYHCVRVYSPDGELQRTVGGRAGTAPGELGYVSDALCDADGAFYISEFGENQRISKFGSDGIFVKCWGAPGSEPGQFARIRAMTLGPEGCLYVADACNHRIQVFTRDGERVRCWGSAGNGPGELSYPYDLAFSGGQRPALYVVEYGNHRVQKFTPEGESLGCWGGPGHEPGQLNGPWALAVDSRGQVHVVDSENDRIQRIDF
jgi:DNA-binding beta-propeller fold protein YncE